MGRRMDMDIEGQLIQEVFHIWQGVFIPWQQGRK